MKAVIATWPGGGNVQPMLGIGRLLLERGHDVRVFASASLAARVEAAGCRFEPWPAEHEIDPSLGRAFEDQWPHIYHELLLGPAFGNAFGAVLAAEPADVVAIDFMLQSAAFAVEKSGLPLVQVAHMTYRSSSARSDDDADEEWGWRWAYGVYNRARAEMGLEPLPIGPENARLAMVRRATAALVVMPREFDDWPDLPANLTHVGPIFEERPLAPAQAPQWDSPWPAVDHRALVVISLGSTYMHQEQLLAGICRAVSRRDRRVVLLTGPDLAPTELGAVPDDVAIRRFVPHAAILADAALLITHGGMGTLMAAFAAGVPTICFPLGRDQASNAARAEELGSSITLPTDSNEAAIAGAVDRALGSAAMRASALRMQAAVGSYGAGKLATAALERVAGAARTTGTARLT